MPTPVIQASRLALNMRNKKDGNAWVASAKLRELSAETVLHTGLLSDDLLEALGDIAKLLGGFLISAMVPSCARAP